VFVLIIKKKCWSRHMLNNFCKIWQCFPAFFTYFSYAMILLQKNKIKEILICLIGFVIKKVSNFSFFSTNETSSQYAIYEFFQSTRVRPMLYPILEKRVEKVCSKDLLRPSVSKIIYFVRFAACIFV